jgi:hypothetical protein
MFLSKYIDLGKPKPNQDDTDQIYNKVMGDFSDRLIQAEKDRAVTSGVAGRDSMLAYNTRYLGDQKSKTQAMVDDVWKQFMDHARDYLGGASTGR